MKKVSFISLGCTKNRVDAEVMMGLLAEAGHDVQSAPQEADVIVVHTCGFIDSAKQESINAILEQAEQISGAAERYLIVSGCLVQRYAEDLFQEIPEAHAFLGTGSWHRIHEVLQDVVQGKRGIYVDANTTIYDESMPRLLTSPDHTAYIKVAEGCSNCCSYCAIPGIRGPFRSRTMESVIEEAKALATRGVKEVVLIAQDTTRYGIDLYGRPVLSELLQQLAKITGIHWLRLLYCYPQHITPELLTVMAEESKVCRYLDLPLQHCNDQILRDMNRRDTKASLEQLLAALRQQLPGVVLRTSLIVGFPGETEEQFQELCDFVAAQRFDHLGVFMYSREDSTPAGTREDQVPEEVKEQRYHALMALQASISEEINCSLEGNELDVIVEEVDPEENMATGRSYREAPEVDGEIYIEQGGALQVGEFVRVQIEQGFAYDLVATVAQRK